jgi:large subunit ribosomal protein L32e
MSESESKTKSPGRTSATRKEVANLLEIRRKIKSRTPYFRRFESWRYVRLDDPWRKPKGVDNHQRLSVKGWPHLVKVGYRVPKAARYLHPSGYRDVLVHNLKELESLSPETDAARLAAGLGGRKRIELAQRAGQLGIKLLNGRNLLTTGKKVGEKEGESDENEDSKKKK